jgi:hypothetical protein
LGWFYEPTNSVLINTGYLTADQWRLYHFTTQTNQVKETNSVVDIGYHYVAVNTNGNAIDSNGNGTPDYLEDTTGSGQGLTVTLISPANSASYPEPATVPLQAAVFDWRNTVTNVTFLKSSNSINTVTVSPFSYSWPIVAAGAYTLSATARDNGGLSATSSPISITVTNFCGY